MTKTALRKKPHRRPKRFVIVTDVFPANIFVQVGGTESEAFTWFAKHLGAPYQPGNRERLGAFITYDGYSGGCIWLSGDKPEPAIVAHECLHAVFHVLGNLGMGTGPEGEEAYCYLLDNIIGRIMEKVRGR